jgi:hypothetical protein
MSESTFALVTTLAVFFGMAAWPVFLDGCALWANQHPLQRLIAELERIDADEFLGDTVQS